jgi:hypothetical protein
MEVGGKSTIHLRVTPRLSYEKFADLRFLRVSVDLLMNLTLFIDVAIEKAETPTAGC